MLTSKQRGSIALKNKRWTGRYTEVIKKQDGTLHRAHRRITLGEESQLTAEQARQRFDAILNAAEFQPVIGSMTLSDTGTVGELLVAADLIGRGFDVFRNLSPNGPVDLITLQDGVTRRIQVKKNPTRGLPSQIRLIGVEYDILAIVTLSGQILYYNNSESSIPVFFPGVAKNSENCENIGVLTN